MRPINVLVADDSPTVCAALKALLGETPDIKVVGVAANGVEAVTLAKRLRPDVVTMDVRMPQLDGLEATAAIMASSPTRILVVCAVAEESQQDLSFRAMAAGALEVVAKPPASADLRAWGLRLAESIRLMAEVPVITRRRNWLPGPRHRSPTAGRIDVIGIVSSTGGPPALARILSALPADVPVPILVAQHMASGFASGLERWLASVGPLPVHLAQPATVPLSGHVYLAPDERDLLVDHEGVFSTPRTPGGHCPSGDRMLVSIARAFGARAAGFVLTGMGDDGVEGLRELRRLGAPTFAQDEATSVVYGMPRAARDAGVADQILPIDAVAPTIRELCDVRRTGGLTQG